MSKGILFDLFFEIIKMKFTIAMKKNWLLKKLPRTDLFEVREEFSWWVDYDNKLNNIMVPKWFKTNFWSIPRTLRVFFSPTKYISYILHDWLYYNSIFFTRKEADKILLEALNVEWASKIEKFFIYSGVRIFGWYFYK